MPIDLFERIIVTSKSEAEKLELMERGDDYLKVLSKDDSLAVRIRAKVRLQESKAEKHQRRIEDLAYLEAEANSPEFGRRLKAKILLRRFREYTNE